MGIVNLAHAAFMMLAAFMAFCAFKFSASIRSFRSSSSCRSCSSSASSSIACSSRARSPTRTSAASTVLLTFALALVIEGTLGFLFTNIYRSTNPTYASSAILVRAVSTCPRRSSTRRCSPSCILGGLWAFLQYTRTGYAIRATMHNRTAAEVVGVNVDRISMLVFGIGMALAGASGSMLSFLFSFYPSKHWEWVAILLSLVVLGGMGSLLGALIGALSLSVIAAFVSSDLGPTWSPVTFYLALFVILLVAPAGPAGQEAGVLDGVIGRNACPQARDGEAGGAVGSAALYRRF